MDRSQVANEAKIVGDTAGKLADQAAAAREVTSAERLAADPMVQKVLMGAVADQYLNGEAGKLPSVDAVGLLDGDRFVLGEAKGTRDIQKAVEQFNHAVRTLQGRYGAGCVERIELVVPARIVEKAGFWTVNGVLWAFDGARGAAPVLVDGRLEIKVVYTRHP